MQEHDPTRSAYIDRDALQREAQQWLVRLTSGRATAGDADALRRWCSASQAHAEAFAEANRLWDTAGLAAQRVSAGASVLARRQMSGPLLGRRGVLAGAFGATAAVALYLAARPPLRLWPSVDELAADYRTTTGETRQIAAADGVSIDLNTRSSLNVRAQGATRQFELVAGEAAVVVTPDASAPVTILAAGGSVQAADARLNLRCDAGKATVTCDRGTVNVAYAGKSSVLRAGQQLSYANGTVDNPAAVDLVIVMAWREGQLIFRQTPLSQVIDEVNRYRAGRIVLMNDALGRRLVEARIAVARIDDLIVLVREAYGAKVTTLPGGVLVLT